MQDDPYT
ncbi:hypothetical protein RDI58_029010 [Solanum bulbocastanum]